MNTAWRWRSAPAWPSEAVFAVFSSPRSRTRPAIATSVGILVLHLGMFVSLPRCCAQVNVETPSPENAPSESERELTPEQRARCDEAGRLQSEAYRLWKAGRSREALPLAQKAHDLRREFLGLRHPDFAISLNQLGLLHKSSGEYSLAEKYYVQAMELRKAELGPRHPDYATSLNNLAILYKTMGEYAKAEQLYLQALEIRETFSGSQRSDYATTLSCLAELHKATGEYAKAELYCRKALEMRRATWGPRHLDVATSLNNLAGLYHAMCEYAKAEPLYQQALEITKTVAGPRHPDYALVVSNLAELYKTMGDYAKAKPLSEQALEIRREILGPRHPDYAASLHNLAGLYDRLGEYAQAEPLYQQAFEIRRRALGPRHPDVAANLNNLAALYQAMDQLARAELFYQRAGEVAKEALGPRHPHYATSLSNLAALYELMGEYVHVESLYQQAADIRKEVLGEQHPDYALSLTDLAGLYNFRGEHQRALELATAAAKIEARMARDVAVAVSEAQALNFIRERLGPPNVLLSAGRYSEGRGDDQYEQVWARRGLVQQCVRGRKRQLSDIEDQQVHRRYQDYVGVRQRLAALLLSPPGADLRRAEPVCTRIQELGEQKERLERQLADELPELCRRLQTERRHHRELAERLPAHAVFVDFVLYWHQTLEPSAPGKTGPRRTAQYIAFVLAAGAGARRVEIGPAEPIIQAIRAWRADLNAGTDTYAPRLRQLLWHSINEVIPSDVRTVYLCLDGTLSGLPWAALPGRNAGNVLLDDYDVAVVPYGQFLLEQLSAEPSAAEEDGVLLAVGDVAYDNQPRLSTAATSPAARSDSSQGETGPRWARLDGLAHESAAVASRAADRQRIDLVGTEASSERVLQELPRARWAHFATHGFFDDKEVRSGLQPDAASTAQRARGFGREHLTVAARNPLVLSGLVLAGANLPRERDSLGLPTGDGGILTGEAIAGLDLSRLELAVLSACETGLGTVGGGEGVFGLQRAFHLAGARNVVASLWKVDDAATAAIMDRFYGNLWQKKLPPLRALCEAQRYIYRHPDEIQRWAEAVRAPVDLAKPAPLPQVNPTADRATAPTKKWAAFVLSGPGN